MDQSRDHMDRRSRESTRQLELSYRISLGMYRVTSPYRYSRPRDECDDPRMRILVRRTPGTDRHLCSTLSDARELYRLLDREMVRERAYREVW